ncbi:MAG: 5'-methylthioadenosine/adenosylhomocysteine nucleosidase [Sedimentisphaerales bacterium]|nr:5'-methylthioadenosine/adenosylhomocysteine nucleosidase [Sedimentisphaerales bacterium]
MRQSMLLLVACISAIAATCSCKTTPPAQNAELLSNETAEAEPAGIADVTAILGAFHAEITLLQDKLTDRKECEIEGIKFAAGRMNGRDVVTVWTGVGKVNAAMTTTLLIEHFKPKEVIFTGIAGGVDPNLQPGDIVIAHKTAHHDMGTIWPEGLFFRGVKNPLTGIENPVFFHADEELVKLAERAGEKVGLRKIDTVHGPREPRVLTGVVVTGDTFVASEEKCLDLRKRLDADAVEMEGAAVAQICRQRNIPHVVIRSISDNADAGAVVDKQMFYILAAQNSSSLVSEMMLLAASSPDTTEKAGAE